MARPLRIEMPDGVYHVTSRGLERRPIVLDDQDRRHWAGLLDAVATRRRWRVLAWVLMDNHAHLFLRTPDGDLSAGMHDLNSGYVTGFNRRHERCGPLLQGRFKAILVESGYHYWELSRYIHLNPVRAGIVGRPEEHPWGSCAQYRAPQRAPEWLAWEEVLAAHGRTVRAAQRAYAQFLAAGVTSPAVSPLRGVVASTLLGSEGFVERMRAWLADRLPDREVPAARQLRRTLTIEAIQAAACRTFGVEPETLSRRRGRHNDARAAALYLCRKLTGSPIALLGERFGGVSGQAVSLMASQFGDRLRRDRRLARQVRECEADLAAADLAGAREVIAINAVRGARTITHLDGHPIGSGSAGPWSQRLALLLESPD
jgi:REP element-mobilizing transposase RayT